MRHRPRQTARRSCEVLMMAISVAIAACSDSSTGTGTHPLVDSRLVAFVSDSGNDCCGHSSIFVMHADGSHTTKLTSNDQHDDTPAWSPDGSTIAFFSDRTPVGIWVVDADGSSLRSLVSAPFNFPAEPAWSPDGHLIAFSTSYTDSLDNFVDIIEIADADGSNPHQLTTAAAQVASPAWSPDGTRILFVAGLNDESHLSVVKTDGTQEHQITTQIDFEPQWSPDGSQIAFTTLDTNNYNILAKITVVMADGSSRHTLTTAGVMRKPSWSPDGRQIAYEGFERDSTAGPSLTPLRLYRMNADGSDKRAMTPDSAMSQLHFKSWSPAWKPTS